MPTGLDLNKVAIFCKVVEQGSFTRAAALLGVPKSTVSRALSDLEAQLGCRLLQRTTRRQVLTDAGRAFHARARRALGELELARSEVSDLGGAPRGVVRLTAPVDLGSMVLPTLLARFAERYPEIHVECSITNRVVDLLGEGIDLALRAGRLSDSSLVVRKIASGELGLFAAPRYLQRRGTPGDPAELDGHAFVLFRPRQGHAELLLSGPGGVTRKVTVTGPLGADDLLFIRRATLCGAGIGVAPVGLGRDDLARRQLVRVLPEWAIRGAQLSLVVPSRQFLPRRVRVLHDFLLSELPEHWE